MALALRERRTSVDLVAGMKLNSDLLFTFNWPKCLEKSLTAPCHPLVSVVARWHPLALALAEMGPWSCHNVDPPWSPWICKTTPCSKPWSVTVGEANSMSSWPKEMAAPGVAIRSAYGAMSFQAIADGRHITYTSASLPDGVFLKACGSRSEVRCPACAQVYRGDARQLVRAGLEGGKGVSEAVAGNPAVFSP